MENSVIGSIPNKEFNSAPEIKFCLCHGYQAVAYKDREERMFHEHFITIKDSLKCLGPFAEVPPPPPLTEEDWEEIFMKEMDNAHPGI